jgi:dolichol-phosphate hexosyltransferase
LRVSLIVPTLNESEGIGFTLESFRLAAEKANQTLFNFNPISWQVLVIDGGSTDRTVHLASERGAQVIHEPDRGYGRAYKTGFEHADGEIIATMDGDGTYPCEYVPWLVSHLVYHGYDFIIGDRFAVPSGNGMSGVNWLGNFALAVSAHVLFPGPFHRANRSKVIDLESGMWVFRREALKRLELRSDGTTFSQEIKIRALLAGLKFAQVPIPYYERLGSSKLRPLRDGATDLLWLFRERFKVR